MANPIPLLETFEITLSRSGVAELAFNRPARSNALNPAAYRDWLSAIQWAAKCDEVKVVVLTGRGKYYSSGQELMKPDLSPEAVESNGNKRKVSKTLVDELISFPKLIIGAVNGPAMGFAVTTLALCDVVYSVPEATFMTPFMKLAFCAEGCSSLLFPRIMGPSKANEMLLMGRSFTAKEMEACGFIGRLIPVQGFREKVLEYAEEAAKFSAEALATTKKLIRDVDRQTLLDVNQAEMIQLTERMKSKDSIDNIMKFVEDAKRNKASKLEKQNKSKI